MTVLAMKLCGLSENDTRSFKSKLSVAQAQLNYDWTIVNSDSADLFIYSFDTDKGQIAWHKHDPTHVSALLSSDDETGEDVDFIIEKPLRTKLLSTTLRNIEEKIITAKKLGKKPSLFSGLLSSIRGMIGIQAHRPAPVLHFSLPQQQPNSTATLTEVSSLTRWLNTLNKLKTTQKIEAVLGNLIPLNRLPLPPATRFQLLELYADTIQQLVVKQHSGKERIKQKSYTEYTKRIHALALLIAELTLGYQIIIEEFYRLNKKPNSNDIFIVSLNRCGEYLSLSIQHSYHHYLSPNESTINSLHQLYCFCEYHNYLVATSPTVSSIPFLESYNTILLSCIANPSHLSKQYLIKLYALMNGFAEHVEVTPYLLGTYRKGTGIFALDLSTDKIPVPLAEFQQKQHDEVQSRLFNALPVLTEIEGILQHLKSSAYIDKDLLNKIIPELNASHTRSFKRNPPNKRPKIDLITNLNDMHHHLTTATLSSSIRCTVVNEGIGGMMINSDSLNYYHLELNDFVAILDSNSKLHIAVVRWMKTNKKGASTIGLESVSQHVTPVSMQLENKMEPFIGLILTSAVGRSVEKTIIVDKETYLPLQKIKLTAGKKTYKISIDSLLESTSNCQQFSFKTEHNN